MSQSNADLVRSGYEAFAAGDIPAVNGAKVALLVTERNAKTHH